MCRLLRLPKPNRHSLSPTAHDVTALRGAEILAFDGRT